MLETCMWADGENKLIRQVQ